MEEKSSHNAYMECARCGKMIYTVLSPISAAGHYMAPLTIYKGKNLSDTWTKGNPSDMIYSASSSGSMQDNMFEKWLEQFIDCVKKPKLTLSALLIYDGHASHLTFSTVKKQ